MISTYFNAFISGDLNSYWTHLWLLGGIFLFEVIVGVGIILEVTLPMTSRQIIATGMVVGGILFGIMLTLGLFVFDEGVSSAQQSKIIALETQLSPSKEQHDALQGLRGKVLSLSFMSSPDVEPAFFSAQLQASLIDAGIEIKPYFSPPGMNWVGTLVYLPKRENDNNVVDALLFKTLTDIGLNPAKYSFDELGLPVPRDVPLIIVGARPFVFTETQPHSVRLRMYPQTGAQKQQQ